MRTAGEPPSITNGEAWTIEGVPDGRYVVLAAFENDSCVRDPDTREPAPELAEAVIDAALQRGLLLLKAGVHGNCIRVLCPLTISEAELDDGLHAWEEALATTLG